MNFCPAYPVTITSTKNDNWLIYRARCKRWSCQYCSVENRKIWRGRIMSEIESTPAIKIWYFWTITLLGKDHKGIEHSVNVWRDKWSKLRKRITRNLGKLRYVRVFEMHKDGTMHIHMLCDKSYDDVEVIPATKKQKKRHESETLRDHLDDLGLGYIHDIKPILTENIEENGIARNVSKYIVKYMTKDAMSYAREVLRNAGTKIRIVQTSHKFYNETKKDSDVDWTDAPLFKTTYLGLPKNKTAKDIATNRTISIDDFHDYDYYPNPISDLIDIADSQES